IAGSDGDADAAKLIVRSGQSLGELPPSAAAVGGFVEPAACSLPFAVLPGSLPRRPEHAVDGLRIGWIERQRHGPRILILVKHFFPRLTAVGGTEDAALLVRTVRMSEHGHEHAIRILRINKDGRYLLAIAKS